jgi:hypothetical protein
MEEKDVDLWWDVVHDIVQKYIGKVCKRYERNERLYMHRISHMEKVMLAFEYEPLVLFPKVETSYEDEDRGNTNGAGPLGTRILEEEPRDLKGGKDSFRREVGGETYALERILEPIKSIVQEVSYLKYAFVATKIGE